MKNHLVVALAYNRLCTFEFGCVVEMFALERPELDVDWYRFAVCAEERGPVSGMGGVTVTASHSLALLSRADTIIIPGWRDAAELPSPQLVRRLQAAQFVKRPVQPEGNGRLARLLDWLRSNPALPHSVASMAARAAMSSRTLQRQFVDTTGLSPAAWLQRERVEVAKELLENTQEPMVQVAVLAGFGSEESFRRHFRQLAGTTPTAFRSQFGQAAR